MFARLVSLITDSPGSPNNIDIKKKSAEVTETSIPEIT